jgi:hypothetical protein
VLFDCMVARHESSPSAVKERPCRSVSLLKEISLVAAEEATQEDLVTRLFLQSWRKQSSNIKVSLFFVACEITLL